MCGSMSIGLIGYLRVNLNCILSVYPIVEVFQDASHCLGINESLCLRAHFVSNSYSRILRLWQSLWSLLPGQQVLASFLVREKGLEPPVPVEQVPDYWQTNQLLWLIRDLSQLDHQVYWVWVLARIWKVWLTLDIWEQSSHDFWVASIVRKFKQWIERGHERHLKISISVNTKPLAK